METTLPAQAARLPQRSLALTDPHAYLAQPQFHRSFRCSRTQKRVTYADVGDPNGSPVIYFLPSGCSRYLCIMSDGLAQEVGVRLIAMDRPGSGGTERCDLNARVGIVCGTCSPEFAWWTYFIEPQCTDMTQSLVERLGLRDISILAASGGVMFFDPHLFRILVLTYI
jgi:pimeloyl-ACP methyl ester carboxylesterase